MMMVVVVHYVDRCCCCTRHRRRSCMRPQNNQSDEEEKTRRAVGSGPPCSAPRAAPDASTNSPFLLISGMPFPPASAGILSPLNSLFLSPPAALLSPVLASAAAAQEAR